MPAAAAGFLPGARATEVGNHSRRAMLESAAVKKIARRARPEGQGGNDRARMRQEPGGRRGHARPPGGARRRDRRRHRRRRGRDRQHLRVHRGRQAGVDRRDPRGRAAQGDGDGCAGWWSPAAWPSGTPPSWRAEIPEIDAFIGLDELERAPEAVLGGLARDHLPDQHGALRLYDHTAPRLLATGGVYAYLKVAEGCDNPCTFCHIPAMRGRFRSRTVASLVAEARRLEAAGVRELVLVAQDTTRYGEDLGLGRDRAAPPARGAARRDHAALDPLPLRLPGHARRGHLRADGAREPRLVPYLDIPLQHASRKVLKLMKRGGDARSYRELIARARDAVPGLAVRTTFIVGFPGEGERGVRGAAALRRRGALRPRRGVRLLVPGGEPRRRARRPGARAGPRSAAARLLMKQQERISRAQSPGAARDARRSRSSTGPSPESELLLQGRLPAPGAGGGRPAAVLRRQRRAPGDIVRVRITQDVRVRPGGRDPRGRDPGPRRARRRCSPRCADAAAAPRPAR